MRLILKDKGGNRHFVRLQFCWLWPGGWDIIWKVNGNRKRRCWFWNTWLRFLCALVLGFEENFMQSLSAFLLFFRWQKDLFLMYLEEGGVLEVGLPGMGTNDLPERRVCWGNWGWKETMQISYKMNFIKDSFQRSRQHFKTMSHEKR